MPSQETTPAVEQSSSTQAAGSEVSTSAQPDSSAGKGAGNSEDAVRRQAMEAFTKYQGREKESDKQTTPDPKPGKMDQNAQPEPTQKKPDDATATTIEKKIKVTGRDGKEEEITVSIDQAKRALLRDKLPAKFIGSMSDEDILSYGTDRFLAQREQDRFGAEYAELKRSAANGLRSQADRAGQQTQPQSANQAPAKTGDAAKDQGGDPQAATNADSQAMAPQTQAKWREKLSAIRDAAGSDIADAIDAMMATMQDEVRSEYQQKFDQYTTQNANAYAQMGALSRDILFKAARKDLAADFPEIKDQKVWGKVQELAMAIGESGRYTNPVEQIEDIVREAALAHLGVKGQTENRARQLAGRRKVETDGQADPGPADSSGRRGTGPMTPEAASKQIIDRLKKGDNPEDLAKEFAQR